MPVEAVAAPSGGVWRVGRAPDPLAGPADGSVVSSDQPGTGNRFDSPSGSYRALYFATTLDGCFGETLARFRPDPAIRTLIADEWSESGFMAVGDVPADWRQRRVAVHVTFPDAQPFLDVESLETREALRVELGDFLAFYGVKDLDVSIVRGADRRVTRYIGQWAHQQTNETGERAFAGIRYLSRLNTAWECWSAFDETAIREVAKRPILRTDESLQRVAKQFKLTIH